MSLRNFAYSLFLTLVMFSGLADDDLRADENRPSEVVAGSVHTPGDRPTTKDNRGRSHWGTILVGVYALSYPAALAAFFMEPSPLSTALLAPNAIGNCFIALSLFGALFDRVDLGGGA